MKTLKVGNIQSRQVQLSDKTVGVLKLLINGRLEGCLFIKSNGRKVCDKDLRKSIEKCRRSLAKDGYKNALKIHLHTFRHFYGSKLYHKTKDPLAVKHALGHNSLRSTEVYMHLLSKLEWKTETVDIKDAERIAEYISQG